MLAPNCKNHPKIIREFRIERFEVRKPISLFNSIKSQYFPFNFFLDRFFQTVIDKSPQFHKSHFCDIITSELYDRKVALICWSFCWNSAWGESLFMSIQTTLLVILYFHYTGKSLVALLFPVLYAGVVFILLSGVIPVVVLVQMASLNILFIAISRVSHSVLST